MFALPPKADIARPSRDVRYVPGADEERAYTSENGRPGVAQRSR